MITNKRLYSAVISILFAAICYAHPYLKSRSITTVNGLPSNHIYDIVQDHHGYIWMGTPGGLCRYDGYSFVNYPMMGVDSGMTNAQAGTLSIDEKNKLMWIRSSTYNYACYDLQRERFCDFTDNCNPQKTYQRFETEEDGIWMYEARSGLRHVTYCNGQFACKDYCAEEGTFPDRKIHRLVKGHDGDIWITTDKGLYRIDKSGKLQTVEDSGNYSMGNTWRDYYFFLTYDRIISIYDKHSKLVKKQVLPPAYDDLYQVNANFIWQDQWVLMSRTAVTTMDCRTWQLSKPSELQMEYGIVLDRYDGNFWVSDKSNTLYLFPAIGKVRAFHLLPNTGFSISKRRRFSAAQTSDGHHFIATYGNGLFIYSPKDDTIVNYDTSDSGSELNSNYLNSIFIDRDDNIWICQEEAGAVCLSHQPQMEARHLPLQQSQKGDMSNYVQRMKLESDGNVMIYTRSHKSFRFFPNSSQIQEIGMGTFETELIDSITDTNGRVWRAKWEEGITLDDHGKTKQFLTRSLSESKINDFTIDKQGILWIATFNGIYRVDSSQMDINDHDFRHYSTDDGLPSNNITSLMVGSDSCLWAGGVGTGAIRCTFDDTGKLSVETINVRQGLSSNTVHAITEDLSGNIWISTDDAILCINSQDHRVTSQQTPFPLLSRLNSDDCALTLLDGRLFFGTHDGITIINPQENSLTSQKKAKAYLTNIEINGLSIYEGEDHRLPDDRNRLSLAYNENSLRLFFSSFSYTDQEHCMYEYYMEGTDNTWNAATTENSADYRHLPPGNYTFHLRVDGSEDESTYLITIRQPWYNTWWAWTLYLIIIGSIAWAFYRNWRERFMLHQQMKVEKQVAEFRANFFTQVAHEFRTPLAIISGAVDKIGEESGTQKKPMQTAKRGVRRLTQLVNQLMEFRKINTGNLRLQVEQGEIIGFIRDIYQDFWNAAQQKDQSISFTAFEKKYAMPFDRHFIDTITYNLLSNAIKYTPQGGTISLKLKLEEEMLKMIVEDSGPGIDESRKTQLFQPFMHGFASQGGMGIGLYTAFRIAQAHKGSLTYEQSESLGGSQFTLTIPANESYYETDEYRNVTAIEKAEEIERHADNVILEMLPNALNDLEIVVIEDDPDMLEQIKAEVGIYFKVTGYTNGEIGFKAIKQSRPSLLICDVMLPDTNGYDIVKRMKADEEQRNIPVIMLTALDDEQHQIKGYEAGADDYMVKPCNYRILVARVIQLIKWSESHRFHESSSQETDLTSSTESKIITSQADKRFLEKVNAIVRQHISDPEFSIDQMAELMRMGRTKLYGKVKEMTGMSPNKLFISERMRMAAELLEEGELNISEIGYRVGIPDASYFNKCFKQHFGVAPSKYRKEK